MSLLFWKKEEKSPVKMVKRSRLTVVMKGLNPLTYTVDSSHNDSRLLYPHRHFYKWYFARLNSRYYRMGSSNWEDVLDRTRIMSVSVRLIDVKEAAK